MKNKIMGRRVGRESAWTGRDVPVEQPEKSRRGSPLSESGSISGLDTAWLPSPLGEGLGASVKSTLETALRLVFIVLPPSFCQAASGAFLSGRTMGVE